MRYNIIYADPPWSHDDKAAAGERGAGFKYNLMTIEALKLMRPYIDTLAAEDCLLAMWHVGPMPQEALDLVKAWGFQLKTMKGFTWVKTNKEFDADCIEWGMARDRNGYGRQAHGGKVKFSHRVAWEEKYGEIPAGLCVLHHCDNPACINIDHLFLGTQADNVRDCVSKNRARGGVFYGSNHPMSKLSENAVTEIRSLLPLHSRKEIADMFGVSKSLISQIALGQCRKMNTKMRAVDLAVGMGNWTRANTEDCLFAVRGRPKRVSASIHQTLFSSRRGHSQKPDEARDALVELMGDVPRIELFARQRFHGWDAMGDAL